MNEETDSRQADEIDPDNPPLTGEEEDMSWSNRVVQKAAEHRAKRAAERAVAERAKPTTPPNAAE